MSRREGEERRLGVLETAYREILVSALEAAAQQRASLFEDIDAVLPPQMAARLVSPLRAELAELAEEINRLRLRLGWGDFELHQHYLEVSHSHGPNEPGEARRAAAFLQTLRDEEAASYGDRPPSQSSPA